MAEVTTHKDPKVGTLAKASDTNGEVMEVESRFRSHIDRLLFPTYPLPVPLPETIAVRYTEEEAGYVTVRPVVRQIFRLNELLDMILSVTGKDEARIRQLLRSGTVVYHFYRYTWDGFDAGDGELAAALAEFPDPDPARPFVSSGCTEMIFEAGGQTPRHLTVLERAAASKRRLLRRQSIWDFLLGLAAREKISYHGYSYGRHADLYRLDLDVEITEKIAQALQILAPRNLRAIQSVLSIAASILLVCPRPENAGRLKGRT